MNNEEIIMIKMKNIQKVYNTGKVEVNALKGIDITIQEGDFTTILGPSGSGKSTLMNIIGCLDKPTEGEYILDKQNVERYNDNQLSEIRNKNIGFIFQNFNLLPYATAFENVEMPLLFAGISGTKRRERVEKILKDVGLADRMDHKPNEMSGGQRQRVAIARALINNPKIILADEPTGNLDTKTGKKIMELLTKVWKEGNTIIMVSHDPHATKYSDKTIQIVDGQITRSELEMK